MHFRRSGITKLGSAIRFAMLGSLALSPGADASEYFVDAAVGSDANPGSAESPWKTLEKASTSAEGGSTVFVRNGDYGQFLEGKPHARTSYLGFKAEQGHSPVLRGISLIYKSPSNAYLHFEGFDIHATDRFNVVRLENARHVELVGNVIQSEAWAIRNIGVFGVFMLHAEDILIERNRVDGVHHGVSAFYVADFVLRRNFITPSAGSGIQWAGGCTRGLIEHNHVAGAPFEGYPENRHAVKYPHASMISVRSGDVTIRNNVMHGMGSSSGVMFYIPDAIGGETAYSNILMENNAIYDVRHGSALRIYNLGSNVVLRNNLLFSRIRTGDCNGYIRDQRLRYSNSLAVHSIGEGHDGSGLELYNNIMIGSIGVPANAKERNNIVWAWGVSPSLPRSPSGTSLIATHSRGECHWHSRYFESDFFANPVDLHFSIPGAVDFSPAPGSPGANFGDASVQAPWSLGSIGPDGFIREDGIRRTDGIHSAGPYEPRAGSSFPDPASEPD